MKKTGLRSRRFGIAVRVCLVLCLCQLLRVHGNSS